MPYHFDAIVEYEEDFGFCMATNRPVLSDDISIPIKTRFLSKERLQDMLCIPYNYLKSISNRKIRTDRNLVFAKIVDDAWGDE